MLTFCCALVHCAVLPFELLLQMSAPMDQVMPVMQQQLSLAVSLGRDLGRAIIC